LKRKREMRINKKKKGLINKFLTRKQIRLLSDKKAYFFFCFIVIIRMLICGSSKINYLGPKLNMLIN